MNSKISTKYKAWLKENHIGLDRRIKIEKSKFGGIGVFAKSDIQVGEVLVNIPKSSVLSVKSCGIADLLDAHDIDGINGLTLAYMFEKGQGPNSPWSDYLNTFIGDSIPSLPRWWSDNDKSLLKGTEIEYMGGLDDSDVQETYNDIAKPFIDKFPFCFPLEEHKTFEGYCQALVSVCSRAFEVDNFLNVSLVPFADLFNHSDKESVNFQTNPDVCIACGLLDSCDHDVFGDEEDEEDEDRVEHENGVNGVKDSDEDIPELIYESDDMWEDEGSENESKDSEISDYGSDDPQSSRYGSHDPRIADNDPECPDEDMSDVDESDDDDQCDIVAVKRISAGSEIFNTYGDYSNALLLAKYGFAIWNNCHETISLAAQLKSFIKKYRLQKREVFWSKMFYRCVYRMTEVEYEALADDDSLNGEELPPPPETLKWTDTVDIESDGTPSRGLLLMMTVLVCNDMDFRSYEANVIRDHFDSIPTTEGLDIFRHLIDNRLACYEDGRLSSKDYKKLIDKTTGTAQIAAIVRGTEKLVLENAIAKLAGRTEQKKSKKRRK